ncbi:acyltransferase [Chryseobacterium sp. Y16C]|uniref:acyltransferase family protein n=1 Tax=Chryseobacterium sp. Y16C TaxID=2920939 RepID=UPI001F0AB44B|nr:acyltransferase [Chryseobacterium sp. Y16C]UMQ40260.1 acyltransferase [Chryseobacterium sp. Y16C]
MLTTLHRKNNFDILRLIFASLVIVSHSFPLTGEKEILSDLTKGQLTFGALSVDSFFIMSGYLIFISLKRSNSWLNYLWKRLLRLYPALFILMLFTLLVVPFVYTGKNIFHEKLYWTYAPNCLSLYKVQYDIPGVFEKNIYPKAINGSLWSLSYEFTMYLFLLLLYPLRKSNKALTIIILTFIVSYLLFQFKPYFLKAFLASHIYLDAQQLYRLAMFFLSGSILTCINLKKYNTLYIRILLCLALIVSLIFNFYPIVSPFILPIIVLFIGTLHTHSITEKLGDISYGVYIYGFIVQQILMFFFHLNSSSLMVISLLITYILAYCSWHIIEERMLKYKNIL